LVQREWLGKLDLSSCHNMACLAPVRFLFERELQVQVGVWQRDEVLGKPRDNQDRLLMRFNAGGHLKLAAIGHLCPICRNPPLQLEVLEADKVVSADDAYLITLFRNTKSLNWFNGLLVLKQAWSRSVSGITEAVQDKVVVVWLVSKVTSIAKELFSILSLGSQSL